MAFLILDDLDLSEEEFDFLEKDALRQPKSPHKDAPDADHRHTQIETSDPLAQRASASETEALRSEQVRAEMALYRTKYGTPLRKRLKPAPREEYAPRKESAPTYFNTARPWNKRGLPIHFLFEFASGYALFYAHKFDEVEDTFESAEKYINRSDQVFKLEAFHRFSSAADALCQMNAISNSTLTEQLKSFLVHNLPKPIDGKPSYYVAVSDPALAGNIAMTNRMPCQSGHVYFNVIRGLRMKIDKFIPGLKPGDLEKAQLNLARLYSRQRCSSMYKENSMAASSSSLHEVVVVPHRFEGVFIAKGKEDFICTKNLVPGEALYGEELISVQNEDGTEVEYRVWNPVRSKLAAAILCGVKNIWVKPGSRVLYLGHVCGITASHLSDLVGPDGLVYTVGLSDGVVSMVEKRSNVVSVFEKCNIHLKYRMVVGMVDVILGDIAYPDEVRGVAINAIHYLRAGGHYMISTRANYIDSTSQGEDMFAFLGKKRQSEFNPIELVMLKPIEKEHAMVVGGGFLFAPAISRGAPRFGRIRDAPKNRILFFKKKKTIPWAHPGRAQGLGGFLVILKNNFLKIIEPIWV